MGWQTPHIRCYLPPAFGETHAMDRIADPWAQLVRQGLWEAYFDFIADEDADMEDPGS